MRDWLAARPDLAFDAVKYRSAVKAAVRHAHLALAAASSGPFLFAAARRRPRTPRRSWRPGGGPTTSRRALYDLPYTVAEGFAARHRIAARRVPGAHRAPAHRGWSGCACRSPHGRRPSDASTCTTMPLTRLASYVLALSLDDRARRRDELTAALRTAARRTAGRQAGRWGRVVAVLDDSFSAYGSGQKRRRPLAVALACHFLLEALAAEYTPLWLSGRTDALLVHPYGRDAARRADPRRPRAAARRASSSSPTAGTTRRRGWRARCCGSGAPGSTPAARVRDRAPQPGVRRRRLRRTAAGARGPDRRHPRRRGPGRARGAGLVRGGPHGPAPSCAPTWRAASRLPGRAA